MKTESFFPAAYRHFVLNGLTNWEPWILSDDPATVEVRPDFEKSRYASKQCKRETGANFDFYLFARRHDRDDFAFFVVRDGVIEDRVLTIHLSFVDKMELRQPLLYEDVNNTFLTWIRNVALVDTEEWIDE